MKKNVWYIVVFLIFLNLLFFYILQINPKNSKIFVCIYAVEIILYEIYFKHKNFGKGALKLLRSAFMAFILLSIKFFIFTKMQTILCILGVFIYSVYIVFIEQRQNK